MENATDILVIGGGPAGLAAAIAARKKGFSVTAADGAKPPIDKACGEGLLPGTLAALRELGIHLQTGDGRIFRRIRFIDGSILAEAEFMGEGGIGVRRTVLHQKMVERAKECGVRLLWKSPVTAIFADGAVVGGKTIHAKWIVGADGAYSRVRGWSGLEAGVDREVRFAQRRHYRGLLWRDGMEVYWGRKIQAYVTPLGHDETCVVMMSRDPFLNFEEALGEFPRLSSSLRNGELSSVRRSAVTATWRLDRVYRGNVVLAGDASGSVDAITGEGLGLSFRQALALADALEAGELQEYQAAHKRLARRPRVMARLLLLLDHFAPLRKRVLRGLSSDPDLFRRMLTAHVRETSSAFLAELTARLGWRLIARKAL